MKKALAVLVIMMVALVAVFAETTETVTNPSTAGLTLKQYIEGRVDWALEYQNENGEWTAIGTNSEMNVNLNENGNVDLRVRLNSNTATVKTNTYKVEVTDFEINERGESYVKDSTNSVATTFSFNENVPTGAAWTTVLSDGKNAATISTVPNVRMTNFADVATGSVSWTGNNDLVAGNYKATVTVTITNVQ